MKFLITNADSSVMIMDANDGIDPRDEVKKWGTKRQALVVNIKPLQPNEIPASREFRDAWIDVFGLIKIHAPKAKDIQLEKLRTIRNARLVELDIALMVANETNQDTTKILAERKYLRDCTTPLKNLTVPEIADEATLELIRQLGSLNP